MLFTVQHKRAANAPRPDRGNDRASDETSVLDLSKTAGSRQLLLISQRRAQTTREEVAMKISPFHSIKSDVHHDNTSCKTGNNIESENLRQGTGGKPKCSECKSLS